MTHMTSDKFETLARLARWPFRFASKEAKVSSSEVKIDRLGYLRVNAVHNLRVCDLSQ